MGLSLDELTAPISEDSALETFLSILETLSIPARSWRKGGVARTILRILAKTYSGFTELMAAAIKAGFLDTAEGDWLSQLAYYVYGVTRIDATFATGNLTLTNNGGGVYAKNPDEVKAKWTATGKVYSNAEAFTLNPGETKSVSFRAVEAGSSSSAPAGEIDALETFLAGVVVTNPLAVVGADAEDDADLRQRCRDKLSTLSPRGPRGAYAYAVRTATRPDGSAVDINRWQISPSSSTGVVTVYVASPSGAPDPTDMTYVANRIEEVARPDSVTVNVLAASPVAIARNLTVWCRRVDGLTATDIETLVNNALLAEITSYPIGGISKPPATQGYLYADFLAGVVKSAHSSIYDVDGTGADIAISPGQVAVLATTITVRIIEVS